jgi:PRTRC genetic system protein C
MVMKVDKLPREFVFDNKGKKITLPDPDPSMPVEQVKKFYSATYPELTNADMSQPEPLKTKVKYTFSFSAPRTKG